MATYASNRQKNECAFLIRLDVPSPFMGEQEGAYPQAAKKQKGKKAIRLLALLLLAIC